MTDEPSMTTACQAAPSGESPRILVVDDEVVVARILARWLSAEGYQCTVCTGGQEAWERAQAEPFALSSLALSGLVRIVTNPKVFEQPSTSQEVFGFIGELRRRPNAHLFNPGPGHWAIFEELCLQSGATGKLVADAYHAALAIEHGCVWVTTDADFARFPGLRWEHPLRP